MTYSRHFVAVSAAVALVLTACGGSDSSSDTTVEDVTTASTDTESTEVFTESTETEPADTTPAETEPAETAPAETEPAETEPTETTPPETTPPETTPPETTPPEGGDTTPGTEGEIGAPAEGVVASLVEWAIEAPTEYAAGDVTFTATNNGNFPHELVVIQAENYESLPLAEGGAVIEDELPTGALIGRTARIGGGSSEDLTVPLAPGNYVLLCNLGNGGTSHAGRGQRLDITVS